MSTMTIECPERVPILGPTDTCAPSEIDEWLRKVFPGRKLFDFRGVVRARYLNGKYALYVDDWNAVMHSLGYTEDAGWCYV